MTDWNKNLEPLFEKYGRRKHPLDYKNRYQLMVMVLLSARDSDKHINALASTLFERFPSVSELAKATQEELSSYVGTVVNFENKTKWLMTLAKMIGKDSNIPETLEELTKLPGIGRKSANVIIRESGGKAEGIIVDLHVVRVAPRIGLALGSDPVRIEKQLMERISREKWTEAGMSLSFLGRETCRPTNPKCVECPVKQGCEYYQNLSQKIT